MFLSPFVNNALSVTHVIIKLTLNVSSVVLERGGRIWLASSNQPNILKSWVNNEQKNIK